MIAMSTEALNVVTGSYVSYIRAQSWLGDQLLAEDVPVSAGSEEVDSSLAVPERIMLSVPKRDRGTSWEPLATDHPLASYGQRLKIELGVQLGAEIEWIQRGWFLVYDTQTQRDTVSVECAGLLQLIQEARLVSPYQPTGTFVSTVRGLIEPALTADIDAGLTDRPVSNKMSLEEDRLDGLNQVLDAWPADAFVNEEGLLAVIPDTTSSPVMSITDGKGGTVIQWEGNTTRNGAFNAVVARGVATDGGQIQGVAFDMSSPLAYGGLFNPLPVPFFYFSPLLTTVAQCKAAAATILKRLRRNAARKLTAELVPHPGLQVRDVLTVTGAGLVGAPCIIDAMSLPYTPDRGAMRLDLRVL